MLNRNLRAIRLPSFDHQHSNMLLRRISAAGTGLSSSIDGDWHHIFLRTFPLFVGAMALTTTLLLGSFLWGYISRKTKHSRDKPENHEAFNDLYPHASYKPNTVITMHDFTKSVELPAPQVKDYDNNAYFDTLVFDPEQDYAQVLAEARKHAATNPPVPAYPVSHSSKAPRVPRSHSARHHKPFLEDLEAMFPQSKDTKLQDRFKSSKSWKKLLFWKKSKKNSPVEYELGNGLHSSCTTPLHHASFKSKMRATVTPTTTSNGSHRTKRANSGPVYSDGLSYVPASRASRPCSGPLSGSSTPSREGLYESPYIALKKPGHGVGDRMHSNGSHKSPSGPLYVT